MLNNSVLWALLFVSLNTSAFAEKITIAADVWCPVNCLTTDKNIGYMVEIAQLIFEQHDITIDYQIMPWARAVHEADKGNINGVIGAFKGDAPNLIFPEEELGLIGNYFFALKQLNWTYNEPQSLKQVLLGVIKDYDYGANLSTYLSNNAGSDNVLEITGDVAVSSRAIKLLAAKRIDVLVESDLVFWHNAGRLNLTTKFRQVGKASPALKTYIAFSPSNPKSVKYAQILSQGMLNIRQSGELTTILAKYGLKDWKQPLANYLPNSK